MAGQSKRFALSAARTMLYHLLLGLAFIHSKGLAHGDFHAGNSLFSLRDMSKASIEDLRQSGWMAAMILVLLVFSLSISHCASGWQQETICKLKYRTWVAV